MEKSLSTRRLIEYLCKVKELEASCYQQHRILNGLQREIDQSYSNVQNWTQTTQKAAPAKPKKRIIGNLLWPIIIGLLGIVAGIVLYYIILIFLLIPSFINDDLNAFADNPHVFVGFMIGGFILGFCVCIVIRGMDRSDEKKGYATDLQQYNEEQSTSRTNINLVNIRIPQLQDKLTETQKKLAETQSILSKFYGLGYIYPKYQALVPVCSILEYLESGRCDTLTGPNGAYNLYENELRMNIIITKLDDVIRRLDDINDNQRMLASVVRESADKTNRVLNSIGNTLSNIERNTEYSQYYSSVTAANSSYLAWLNTFQYIESR